jgi:hypothetical protein
VLDSCLAVYHKPRSSGEADGRPRRSIDLNPVATGIVELPEASPHTSIKERIEAVKAQNRTNDLQTAERSGVAGSKASVGLEESIWLCPIEDRRRLDSRRETVPGAGATWLRAGAPFGGSIDRGVIDSTAWFQWFQWFQGLTPPGYVLAPPSGARSIVVASLGESVARLVSGLHPPCPPFARGGNGAGSDRFRITTMCTLIWLCPIEDRRGLDSPREGMLEGLSLGSYLLLVEYTGRLFRDGKAAISAELSGILDRLGSTSERWWSRIEKLSKGRLLGRFFAASRGRLRDVARSLGVHHLANLGGCAVR